MEKVQHIELSHPTIRLSWMSQLTMWRLGKLQLMTPTSSFQYPKWNTVTSLLLRVHTDDHLILDFICRDKI